jgi:hypothetical protein
MIKKMKILEILILAFLSASTVQVKAQKPDPITVVKEQLEAYNKQNIEAFLNCYSEEVEVYNFPNELVYKGKEKMRERYTNAWKQNPKQKAEVTERICVGNTVIDKEHVTGRATGIEANVIAIYKIEDGKIKQVFFIRE